MVHEQNVKLSHPNAISYSIDGDTDYIASSLRVEEEKFLFDVNGPNGVWENIELGIPGIHNVENALACIALCEWVGIEKEIILKGLREFAGVHRRFDYHVRTEQLIYIDDYAHHPTEIRALIASVRLMFPKKKITAIFQPHLYSRTRDFMSEFAEELSKVDKLLLLPIYPAREEPIAGITSDALLSSVSIDAKRLVDADQAIEMASQLSEGVILTLGAGDIDKLVAPLTKVILKS